MHNSAQPKNNTLHGVHGGYFSSKAEMQGSSSSQLRKARNSRESRGSENASRVTTGRGTYDSNGNLLGSRIGSASYKSKVSKLIGAKNIELDVSDHIQS